MSVFLVEVKRNALTARSCGSPHLRLEILTTDHSMAEGTQGR